MRANVLKETIKKLNTIKRTICIEGAPGGGKTTITHQSAAELAQDYGPVESITEKAITAGDKRYIGRTEVFNGGFGYIELHMPTMLTEDFGIPDMMGSGASFGYKLPDWFPAVHRTDIPEQGLLCFDDRNQAGADLQKVMANICQARTLHGAHLKDGWQVVSTGNRQSDRAGANRVLSHLRNRETVLELETHLEDWCDWALDSGVRPEIVSFIRFRPGLLHEFNAQRDSNPTPRSWAEGVSDIIDVVPKEAEFECFKGAVGEGAAAEFVGFLRIFRDLPDPDVILMNPDTAEVPTDPATLYALTGALAARSTNANFGRVCTYIERMPPEFSVLTVTTATRRDRELANTEEFARWTVKHQNVLY